MNHQSRTLPGTLVALLVVLGPVARASSSFPPTVDDEQHLTHEERSTRLDLRLLNFLIRDYQEHHGQLELTGRFLPLPDLLDNLEPEFAQRLPRKDAWGAGYMYMVESGGAIFASTGPNGRADRLLSLLINPPEDPPAMDREDRELFIGDDLLQTGTELLCPGALDRGSQKRTMADMRSLATAVEEYAIDNDVYPGPTSGFVDACFLEPFIAPVYIRTVPLTDGWGERFLVWSTGAQYVLISTGSDHVLDQDYLAASPAEIEGTAGFPQPERDIIFANGSFVQWPVGIQRD